MNPLYVKQWRRLVLLLKVDLLADLDGVNCHQQGYGKHHGHDDQLGCVEFLNQL